MFTRAIFITLLLLLASTGSANREIDFSDDTLAKEILLGKTFTCHMSDDHGKTYGTWTFDTVGMGKVKGSIKIAQYPTCNSDILRGKLKNNILKYTATTTPQCREFNGTLNFYYDEEGIIKADGVYTYGGLRFRGKYMCE